MPWLLYRYILGELLRVMVLTTAILVTVIAFGAAIKPLTNEDLLSAGQTAKYIVLAIVPMLQFALPFAAGFAATIVLHRLTSDNEITAAAVSGISYPRLLLPIGLLGAVLALVMVFLTQSLIPVFFRLMQQTITTDVTKVFERAVAQHRPFVLQDTQIYADGLIDVPQPPDSPAERRFILLGVVAADLGADNRIATDAAARQAVVDVYSDGGERKFMLAMSDVVVYDGSTGKLMGFPEFALSEPVVLQSVMKQGAQFYTFSQLLHLRRQPEGFGRVEDSRAALAQTFRELEIWDLLDERFRSRGRAELDAADQRVYTVRADRIDQGILARTDGGAVEVTEFDRGTPSRRFSAARAQLLRPQRADARPGTLDLLLTDVRIEKLGSSTEYVGDERPIPNVMVPDLPPDEFASQGSGELLSRANARAAPPSALTHAATVLDRDIKHLRWDIGRHLHRRFALALTAPLLLLLGGVMAIWLRQSTPLVVYVWAFLPAIFDLILITSGSHMIGDGNLISGAIMTWSGNAALAGLIIWILARVARN